MRRTGGTETSKYPEEKKSTEIPPVAVSERGGAQSLNQCVCWACRSVRKVALALETHGRAARCADGKVPSDPS